MRFSPLFFMLFLRLDGDRCLGQKCLFMKVLIYSKRPCPYCDAAKAYFKGKSIPFEERDLTGNTDAMVELKNKTGHMTFPQIFIDDKFIGGYDELLKLKP